MTNAEQPGMNDVIPPGSATYQRFLEAMQENGDLRLLVDGKNAENSEMRVLIEGKDADIVSLLEHKNLLLRKCRVQLVVKPTPPPCTCQENPFTKLPVSQAAPLFVVSAAAAVLLALGVLYLILVGLPRFMGLPFVVDMVNCLYSQTKDLQVRLLDVLAMPIKATIMSHLQTSAAYALSMFIIVHLGLIALVVLGALVYFVLYAVLNFL